MALSADAIALGNAIGNPLTAPVMSAISELTVSQPYGISQVAAAVGQSLVIQQATSNTANTGNATIRVAQSGDATGAADTTAIQAAISVMTALGGGTVRLNVGAPYYTNASLINNGQLATVSLEGESGVKATISGGTKIASATTICWVGAASGVILTMDTTQGTRISGINFQTLSTDGTIQTDNVDAIRYINKARCVFNIIERCSFDLLGSGIHFFDDGSNGSSNTNMDSNTVRNCVFISVRKCAVIEQTNVYSTVFEECFFYGDTRYTQYHVQVIKGHVDIRGGYTGALKNSSSVGGANGTAILVTNGYATVSHHYSEAHNAPFLDWVGAEPATSGCAIVGCTIAQSTSTLPNGESIRNRTARTVTIVGGYITGYCRQDTGSGGYITAVGVEGITQSGLGDNDRFQVFGCDIFDYPAMFGTRGSGLATMLGTGPTLSMIDETHGQTAALGHSNGVFTIAFPGHVNGVRFTTAGLLDLASNGWQMLLGAGNTGSLTLATGAATTTVTVSGMTTAQKVALTPTSAAAANLMRTTQCPYVSSVSAGSFVVSTADGTNSPSGCTFSYHVL